MHKITIASILMGGSAAFLMLTGTSALAQMQVFPPGTDCSMVPQSQQTDCHIQHGGVTAPGSTAPGSPGPVLPGGNGTGTNQNGTLTPNGSSGQTGGSSIGAGGGNGGASPPGQSGN
jgi:hypothetical protein